MKPIDDIQKFYKKAAVDTNPEKEKKVLNKIIAAQTKTNIWRIIMRCPLTKYAAALVIVSLIYFTFQPEQYAWADVIKALNHADDIHVITKVTRPDRSIEIENIWLKNKTMFRGEETDTITIDNGVNCLSLDVENKTARLSDSNSPYMADTGNVPFSIILRFNDDAPSWLAEDLAEDYRLTELTDEYTDNERVYEIAYRDFWKGKIRIDTKTNLPKRIVITPNDKYKERVLSMEVIYDYEPISSDIFNLNIPEDYQILPEIIEKEIIYDTTYDTSISESDGNILAELDPNILSNLILYYSLDFTENSEIVKDISGNEHNGQVFGTQYVKDSRPGMVMSFDGENDYISISLIHLDKFTFGAWIKPTTIDLNNRRVFLLDNGEAFYSIEGNAGGGISVNIANGFGMSEYERTLKKNQWVYITVTYDNETVKIYLNGQLTKSGKTAFSGGIEGNAYIGFSGNFGNEQKHNGEDWEGYIDEVGLFNRALTDQEVQQLFLMTGTNLH